MAFNVHELTAGWEFKQTEEGDDAWLPVARVPTNVHIDLLANDKIPDPFLGFNELKCEWVGEAAWTYRTVLPDITKPEKGTTVALAFDGLDTFATVKLNGSPILTSDNMFLAHHVDVTARLDYGSKNVLEIDFDCAFKRARAIKDAHPEHKWVGFNGDMARLAVRKAQYHWGWDWGPILCPSGPWRPVRVEIYQTRITDLRIDYTLSSDLKSATGTIVARVEGAAPGTLVNFTIQRATNVIFTQSAPVTGGFAKIEFSIPAVQPWFPHGYGGQPLYDFIATAAAGETDLHTTYRRIGFRRAELVQQEDGIGKSFFFRVNGGDVFCGGSDWIPADSFTPRICAERYRKWLQLMVDGNQVMIRIWGGGIWEEDVFYDLCDELGILVWQDFMFGCGNYPAFPEYLASVDKESAENVRRIRHHPSIVIFAGNNEDYQVQEQFGLTYNYADKDPTDWLKTDFPARYIYEKILPDIVQKEAPHIPYHPGSPWGDGLITSNRNVGDMHQWNVWHGTQEKYQIFDTLGGRFNSEFGMEAFPHIATIKAYCTDPAQLYPQSHMLDFHNKADGHERRIATYLVENFRTVTDLERFIHLTQLSQSEALTFGYRGWRRQWGSLPNSRGCGGALVWQLNDCWPVTSWSIVDFYLRPKPAFYALRRVLAPVAVGIQREHSDWSVVHARPPKTSKWECWVVSRRAEGVRARVQVRFVSVRTGKEVRETVVWEGALVPNGTTLVATGVIDHATTEPHVLAARVWISDTLVARDADWPQPLKYLDFADRNVKAVRDGDVIRVTAERPTKGLVWEVRDGVWVEDSSLDVLPEDEQIVRVRGEDEARGLGYRYLGGDVEGGRVEEKA
ncbi:beta-mannosidase precursor [Trichodelitschia bisporula]|uniref:Beta-mannosidase B n=1 Tax=Trichodelitschia bisporula TaxID=703511 RepID=A0A6G1HJY6_9PEZI|nr:beta-mannosidase precursor [Trichodelitschia bisporula]